MRTNISVDGPALPRLFEKLGGELIAAVAIPFLLLMLAALGGNMIQHRLVWSLEPITPKLSKISPAAGLQAAVRQAGARQFRQGPGQAGAGRHGAHRADVARALAASWRSSAPIRWRAAAGPDAGAKLMGAVVAIMAVVAIADYLFQYRQWYERQKMSLREMKEEFKQSEGDPAIKGKMKQLRTSAHAQAHDGERAQGGGGDHQPDPLRRSPCNTSAAWRRRSASPRASTLWP